MELNLDALKQCEKIVSKAEEQFIEIDCDPNRSSPLAIIDCGQSYLLQIRAIFEAQLITLAITDAEWDWLSPIFARVTTSIPFMQLNLRAEFRAYLMRETMVDLREQIRVTYIHLSGENPWKQQS